MNRLINITIFLSVSVFILVQYAAAAPGRIYRPGELLIQFRQPARAASLETSGRGDGVRALRSLANGRIHHLRLPENLSVEEALAQYRSDPDIEFAEPNYLLTSQGVPNDASFAYQWGLNNSGQVVSGYVGTAGADIDAVRAWDLVSGDETTIVAVVDTGCDLNHPDLSNMLWINSDEIPGNGIDDDGNGYVDDIHGWDFVDDDNTPQDATGHGSHVAGTIGAQRGNAMGIAGV